MDTPLPEQDGYRNVSQRKAGLQNISITSRTPIYLLQISRPTG